MGRRRGARRRTRGDRGRAVRARWRSAGLRPSAATRLPGLTLPGLANCHSHAFHRALRGRTQRGRGTFWTWREQMYDVARAARPRQLPRAGAGDLPGDGGGRDHLRRRVPLPAPPAGRHAVRRPERDGPRPDRGRHARPGSGSRCSTPATSAAGSGRRSKPRRCATPTATRSAGRRRVAQLRGNDDDRDRRRDPLRPRRAGRADADRRRGGGGPAAARAPLRADRRRTTPAWRRTARTPDPAARRPRRPRADDHRRPRHPPHRPTTSDHLGATRHPRLLLPDHRARPRRRGRPEPRAPRRRAAR